MGTHVSTSASRPRGRSRLVGVLAILIVAAGLGTGAVGAQSSPPPEPPVSAICDLMFSQAIVPVASPTPDPFASTSPGQPDLPLVVSDPAALDGAIRACASLDEWEALADAHPEVFGDVEARAFLEARCLDPVAGLDAYATCASLAIVRAAETPVPLVTPEPGSSPGPGDGPASTPAPLVKVPSGLKSRVRGASDVRYFSIAGESPLGLIAEASRKSAKFCPSDAAACTRHRPVIKVGTLIDSRTGACRVTRIQASFRSDVFLPRWTEPAMVEKDLRDWWERMFSRIVTHEAKHIKIANAHVKDLKRRAVGRRCESFRVVYERWSDDVNKDQAAFDQRDAKRPLPAYRGEPVQP